MSAIKTIALSIAGVLAVSLSGLGVNLAFGRDVTLIVDGQPTVLNVVYGSVAEVLASQKVHLEPRDEVSPGLADVITNDMVVQVRYARPIDLTLNGQNGVYWTYATTVAGVLSGLGLGESTVQVSPSQTTPVPREGITMSVETGHDVVVTADGQTQTVHSFGTVDAALSDLGLAWDDDDIVTPAPDTALSDQLAVSIVRVDQQTVTRDVPIPHETENSTDPNLTKGKVTVVTKGADGVLTQTVDQVLHDGVVVSETLVSEQTILEPVTEITRTGTKEPVVAVNVTPGSAQAIAYDMVLARGWDDSQFQCLVQLWNRESGWRVNAENRYSGAYGIPQALPGSKMASAGSDWQTNPATQITWGLGYISGRYGTPCGAWSAFQSKGWY